MRFRLLQHFLQSVSTAMKLPRQQVSLGRFPRQKAMSGQRDIRYFDQLRGMRAIVSCRHTKTGLPDQNCGKKTISFVVEPAWSGSSNLRRNVLRRDDQGIFGKIGNLAARYSRYASDNDIFFANADEIWKQ